MSRNNRKLDKHLPSNIKSALSHVDYETFPFKEERISNGELVRILKIFVRSGKSYDDIKKDLIDVIDGKENEFTDFVKNYDKHNVVVAAEEFLMVSVGVLVSILLFVVYFY